jgi:hypothetical protein
MSPIALSSQLWDVSRAVNVPREVVDRDYTFGLQPLEATVVTIDYRVTPQDRSEAQAALSQVAWPNRPIEVPSPVGQWVLRSGVLVGLIGLAYYLCKRNGVDVLAMAIEHAKRNPGCAGWGAAGLGGVLVICVLAKLASNISTRSIHSRITISAGGVVDEPTADQQPRRGAEKRMWSDFSAWVETQGLFVLRMHQAEGRPQALYIPKRLFQPDQEEYMRQLLRQYIPYPEQ